MDRLDLPWSVGLRADQLIQPGAVQDVPETFSRAVVPEIMLDATLDHFERLVRRIDPPEFPGQLGVSAQLSPHQDAIAAPGFLDRLRGADGDALAAGEASFEIDPGRLLSLRQLDGSFPADFDAGPALGAGGGGRVREACTDEPEIDDLRSRAPVRAIRHGHPEFVVWLERPRHARFQKGLEVLRSEEGFDLRCQTLVCHRPIGAPAFPETPLHLVAAYVFLHGF